MRLLYNVKDLTDQSVFKRLNLLSNDLIYVGRFEKIYAVDKKKVKQAKPTMALITKNNLRLPIKLLSLEGRNENSTRISFYTPPPDKFLYEIYANYIKTDIQNLNFREIFLNGLTHNPKFHSWLLGLIEDSSEISKINDILSQDIDLRIANLPEPILEEDSLKGKMDDNKQLLSAMIARASMNITNISLIAGATGSIPVTEDPHFAQLISLRTSDSSYLGGISKNAPFLGMEIARSVIPDEALQQLSFKDIEEYRTNCKDAYKSWMVELNRLASTLDQNGITQEKIQKLISSEIKPKIIEYENEMIKIRDEMFANILKRIIKWEMPSLSLAYLSDLDFIKASILFLSALIPAAPHLIDYIKDTRTINRKNSLAYLIGLTTVERTN